jgi:hypothetical protein
MHGLRIAPDAVTEYTLLPYFALALQRFEEAREVIHETQARKLDRRGNFTHGRSAAD